MKTSIATVALAVVVLTGCASSVQPRSFSRPTPKSASDVYACAMGHLNVAGYTIIDANKEAGFIKAEKKTSGVGRVLMTGQNLFDQMTISVFEDPSNHQTTLRATAATMTERSMGWGAGSRNITDPAPQLETDANALLKACTEE